MPSRDEPSSDEGDVYYIHRLNSDKQPYTIQLHLNGIPTNFEIDTGSSLTIISEKSYKTMFPNISLQPTKVAIKTYANDRLNVLGKIFVDVDYQGKLYENLKLFVLKGNGVKLVGRSWLNVMQLNWDLVMRPVDNSVHEMKEITDTKNTSTRLASLIKKHGPIFSDKLGKMKNFKASIHVKEPAAPKFCKARTIPFALEESVKAELKRLEDEGVLKSISFSEWASPVVVVTKPGGGIRICGDFKRTVNPIIENEEYPLPTPEELFAKLQGGKKFSKIDLSSAYLQVELDENSKNI